MSNVFLFGPPLPAGFTGPGPAADLFVVFPPTGIDRHLTFICKGEFEGTFAVEGSADGVNFDVICQFTAGLDADGKAGPSLEFTPIVVDANIRWIRGNVIGVLKSPTAVSLGAEINCPCVGPCVPPALTSTDLSIQEIPGPDILNRFVVTFDQPITFAPGDVVVTTVGCLITVSQPAPNTIQVDMVACPGTNPAQVALGPGITGQSGCHYGGSVHNFLAFKP